MRKNLKEARQKAGMTQQQMADKLGISLVYYQKIEICIIQHVTATVQQVAG